MRNKNSIILKNLAFLLFLIGIYSCSKKNESTISSKEIILKVNAQVAPFTNDEIETSNKSSSINNYAEGLIDTTINLNSKYLLKASLALENDDLSNTPIKIAQTPNGKKLANSVVANDVWYRLVVFNKQTGAFVEERLFQRGKEDNESITPLLKLDGGVHYTFIAYSVNSPVASALPALQGPSLKTIANTYINISNADTELLFIKTDKIISGDAIDNLNIIFQRKTAQVDVTINATATGYNVSAINAKILAKSAVAKLNFSDGLLDRSAGSAFTDLPLTFSTLNQPQITSNLVVVNSGPHTSTDNFLTINSITIGDLTVSNLTNILNNVNLSPGKKYNLKITISPTDEFIDNYGGYGVNTARINGQVWMRHNLRISGDYSPTPDIGGEAIYGHYFQWGRKIPVSTSVNFTSTPNEWNTTQNTNRLSWNANTNTSIAIREESPSKGTEDPCPNGFRVPTKKELEKLVSSTKSSYSAGANPPLTEIGILTSRRKASVILTIPSQGSIFAGATSPYTYAGFSGKGSITRLWSSYVTYSPVVTNHFDMPNTGVATVADRGSANNNTSLGMPLRCIAEDSNIAK